MPVRARLDTPLKRVLEDQGRRQTWLAERLGTSPRQVWGWVHGIHLPEQATQLAIAELLGQNVGDLWPLDLEEAA
jgi:hypothetical protein